MARLEKGILKDPLTGKQFFPQTSAEFVEMSDGRSVEEIIGEKDNFTPTITQRNTMSQVGVDSTINVHTSVQDGLLESATLKGQTLVNHLLKCKSNVTSASNVIEFALPMNVAKKYILKFRINSLPTLNESDYRAVKFEWYTGGTTGGYYNHFKQNVTIGKDEYVIIPPYTGEVTRTNFSIWSPSYESGTLDIDVAIFEYQDGMENWDIPYFEGMASVVNPSVTSVGKNLFDGIMNQGSVNATNGVEVDDANSNRTDYILLPKGTYVISNDGVKRVRNVITYNESKVYTGTFGAVDVFTLTEKCYVRLSGSTGNTDKLQLENGSTPTTYEPYKSNTVTTTDEVVLRSLPNGVCDTLNLITGEYVQRIGEKTLTDVDDNNWETRVLETGDYIRFMKPITDERSTSTIESTYKVRRYPTDAHGEYEYICIIDRYFYLQVKKEKLTSLDKAGLLLYLKDNPVTYQYGLATPIVTTVDLTGLPFAYENGHVMLSSDSLLPTLEYQAITSLSGQVTQNTKLLMKHDTQIFNLEMLLITSLLESDYQRLIMQNSLLTVNSDTTTYQSNGLRYYMLSRLIEEGMYDKQDIMNKLDVFLMYGEITDLEYTTLVQSVLGTNESEDENIESNI